MNPVEAKQTRLLAVLAKAPVAGLAKTRLALAFGKEFAQRIAASLLEDTLDRVTEIEADRLIVFAPPSAEDEFRQLARHRFEVIPQCEGDLGQRLKHFFHGAFEPGYTRVVVIGADSPTLPIEHIERAFVALERSDVVLGPASDGGYYLLGSRVSDLPIFAGIPWGTERVLEETRRCLGAAAIPWALLPEWCDVDTPDDWERLRRHVHALREAGLDPGIPRVEQLLGETES